MKGKILLFGALAVAICYAGPVLANDDCPVGLVSGLELDDEFGAGTQELTTCLSQREDVKIVMQLNKPCRDSYATHPVGKNGKPTGEVSRVVNNIANCADSRAYALGNLRNMIKDFEITNGMLPTEYEIKVVVHSGGGYLLLKDESYDGDGVLLSGRNKFQSQVEDLMDMGVKFYFCQNTTRGFIRNGTLPGPGLIAETGGATAQLIDGVEYVTAGVTAISDLQEQGYKYVQP
jgi:intracellular sulfur oxidation DsrE/DsrF family protein